jgi:hypothetical protein
MFIDQWNLLVCLLVGHLLHWNPALAVTVMLLNDILVFLFQSLLIPLRWRHIKLRWIFSNLEPCERFVDAWFLSTSCWLQRISVTGTVTPRVSVNRFFVYFTEGLLVTGTVTQRVSVYRLFIHSTEDLSSCIFPSQGLKGNDSWCFSVFSLGRSSWLLLNSQ